MDVLNIKNENIYNNSKRTLFFITGLDIKIDEYKVIYEKYLNSMNVITISIKQNIFEDYNNNLKLISDYIKNINQIDVFFISHSYGCIILYNILEKINDINKYVVLIEPTSNVSIYSIKTNKNIKDEIKDIILKQIEENSILKTKITNIKNILISQMLIENIRIGLNSINKFKNNNFNNFGKFIELFENNNVVRRIKDFKEKYDNDNTHYIIIPLNETSIIKNISPHFLYVHVPKEIINNIDIFFENSVSSGGRKRKKFKTQKRRYKIKKNNKTQKRR